MITTVPFRATRQAVNPSNIAAEMQIATTTFEILLLQPRFQWFSRHRTHAPGKKIGAHPRQVLRITMSYFSGITGLVPKHMEAASTEPPSPNF